MIRVVILSNKEGANLEAALMDDRDDQTLARGQLIVDESGVRSDPGAEFAVPVLFVGRAVGP